MSASGICWLVCSFSSPLFLSSHVLLFLSNSILPWFSATCFFNSTIYLGNLRLRSIYLPIYLSTVYSYILSMNVYICVYQCVCPHVYINMWIYVDVCIDWVTTVTLCVCSLCLTLWPHGLYRPLCPWDSPGKNTGVGSHSLLQGIFPTRGLNPGLLYCRQILYHLSHQGSPN